MTTSKVNATAFFAADHVALGIEAPCSLEGLDFPVLS